MNADELLQDLTDEQRRAVTHVDGPLLVIAGAGSGKTRVITRRVAYLMAQGIAPESILSITFTNKAAGEMKARISSLMPRPLRDFGRLDQPWPIICTFHSLGLRILKHYAQRLGLPANFAIYDTSDQDKLIKEAIKTADLDPTHFTPSSVHHAISSAKNKLLTAAAYAQMPHRFPEDRYARAYQRYQILLDRNNALDFDDLLLRTACALRDHPDILKELQDRFGYILIDEYQDTNHAQYVVAHALALKHGNICVVGDPDQSIYAWRGADIQNILDFETDYANATVVKLEQNYRSTQTILDIASKLISVNRQRKDKRLWTENGAGEKARVLMCQNEHEEADMVAGQLKELSTKGFEWNQMAIFYRINSLSRVMEDALRRQSIPYRVARGVDFYHRKEIKDILGYLRVIANANDELSLARILNVPARGIGEGGLKQMQAHALANGWSLWQILERIDTIPGVTPRTAGPVKKFVAMVQRWQTMARSGQATSVRALLEDLVKASGMEEYLRKIGGQEMEELANVGELITDASQFDQENPQGTLEDYLSRVSLVSDVDGLKENGGAVTLMTLHAAKGLEFPIVAMIAMEEDILPHARVRDHPEQLEEERRLCFVGITRAQKTLLLSRAERRMVRGQTLPTMPSRFLSEMPREALEITESPSCSGGWQPGGGSYRSPSISAAGHSPLQSGQRVRHPTFGTGTICDVTGMGQHTRVVVNFTTVGRKTLILEFARLTPI